MEANGERGPSFLVDRSGARARLGAETDRRLHHLRHSSRTSLSSRLRIGSNFPLPGYDPKIGDDYYLGPTRNSERRPTYARFDVRADRAFAYRKRRLTLFAEVINVFNRRNERYAGASISLPSGRAPDVTEGLFPLLLSAGVLIEFWQDADVEYVSPRARCLCQRSG